MHQSQTTASRPRPDSPTIKHSKLHFHGVWVPPSRHDRSFRKYGRIWYYRFTDADGIKRERKGCTDRRATEEFARDAETKVARAKAGLTDPKAERIAREARRPIGEHVDEFIAGLESKGNDPKHVRSTRTYIERVIKLAGIERIGDLTPSAVAVAVTASKLRSRRPAP